MPFDPLFQRLRQDLTPSDEARARVRRSILARIAEPEALRSAREAVNPSDDVRFRVWRKVSGATLLPVGSVFEKLRAVLSPSHEQRSALWQSLQMRLHPQHHRRHGILQWVAAFAVLALLVRITPLVFFATPTVADSTILVHPTEGNAYIAHVTTLEPLTADLRMISPVRLTTGPASALTVAAYDDYVVRMGENADVEWHDLSDRPEPAIDTATMTLRSGRVWLHGLVPSHLRGITVATPAANITVHEGSVDIAVSDSVLVRAFDRNAVVTIDGQLVTLVAGEQTQLWPGGYPRITPIATSAYGATWVTANLANDAVHRKEIAQWQQERRAAQAGILPTSTLYPAKRALEKVAELAAFSSEGKVQQKLAQADTRLNEAAALLQEGDVATASMALEEYRVTLLAAAGSESDSVAQFLIRQSVAQGTADFAASAPGDDAYVLKVTALEAGAALPEEVLPSQDVERMLLVDAFAALDEAVLAGDFARAKTQFAVLEPELATLTEAAVAPIVSKQGQAVLRRYAVALREQEAPTDEALLLATEAYVPTPGGPTPLSTREIAGIVGGILDRTVGIYRTERALTNSFTQALLALHDHHDEIRILQQLRVNLVGQQDFLIYYVDARLRELRQGRVR